MKKPSRYFYSYVWYVELHHIRKKQRIVGILEPIAAFHANRDRYFEIYRAFISFLGAKTQRPDMHDGKTKNKDIETGCQ